MIRKSIPALLILALAASWPVSAGDDKKELTPFIGYRFGGEFSNWSTGADFSVSSAESYGFTFDFPTTDETKVEVLFSRQPTEIQTSGYEGYDRVSVDMTYYHVGALYQPSFDEKIQPFVGGTLGATHMSPQLEGASSETDFSLSFTGGVKIHLSEHVGVRLDGRVFATFVNGNSGVFCGVGTGGGGCSFGFSGNALWQGEATAGLILAF